MTDKLVREITPPEMYFNRRTFMRGGILAASAAGTAVLYRKLNGVDLVTTETPPIKNLVRLPHSNGVDEEMTPRASILNYNNFYEFTTNKDGVAAAAANFKTTGWKIEVGGLCHKPKTFDLDDFKNIALPEERVYRHRCVEAWSMVIPWAGFSVAKLLAKVEPLASAKYVAFETLLDPKRFPNQSTSAVLDWPYVEGLRIDEATHPLTLLAVGLYGKALLDQNGAPIRLVVPWKYGFKGIKSIVKISFSERQPPSTWNLAAPDEYGFYANVNPEVDHPRWSQRTERRIGEIERRITLPYNGYGNEVASLYTGMNLRKNF
jgi:sulfoxide reductase catalytic subunit YedY